MKDLSMGLEYSITQMELFIRDISCKEQSMDRGFSYMVLKSINACI